MRGTISKLSMLAAAAGLAGGAGPAPESGATIQPSSKWVSELDNEMCILSRNYGTGDDELQFAIRPLPGDSKIEFALVAHNKASRFYREGTAEVTLMPGGQSAKGALREYSIPDRKKILRFFVDRKAVSGLSDANAIELAVEGRAPVRLALSSTGAAMRAVAECEDVLMEHWGFDPAVQRSLSREPEPVESPAEWLKASDYPVGARRGGLTGVVRARWRVGTDGMLRDCAVVQGSGWDLLDQTTCEALAKRARFRPALDAGGQPVETLFSATVCWRLEG